jgi:hypothetical protein
LSRDAFIVVDELASRRWTPPGTQLLFRFIAATTPFDNQGSPPGR